MFSCKFCEISKNTFFTEHLRATASDSHSGSVRKESLRNRISSRYDISFCFCVFKCSFRTHWTVTNSLWKSKIHVSKVVVFWKLRDKLVKIKTIQGEFFWFLKHIFCLTRFFKLNYFLNYFSQAIALKCWW